MCMRTTGGLSFICEIILLCCSIHAIVLGTIVMVAVHRTGNIDIKRSLAGRILGVNH